MFQAILFQAILHTRVKSHLARFHCLQLVAQFVGGGRLCASGCSCSSWWAKPVLSIACAMPKSAALAWAGLPRP